jgi:hypothetical protein
MIDLPIMRNHQSPPPSPPPDSIFKRDALVHKLRRVARPVDGVIGGAAGEVVLEMGHRSIRNILAALAVVMGEIGKALASLNLTGAQTISRRAPRSPARDGIAR